MTVPSPKQKVHFDCTYLLKYLANILRNVIDHRHSGGECYSWRYHHDAVTNRMAHTKEHRVIFVKRCLWDVFMKSFIQENRRHMIIWKDVKLFPHKTELQRHHRGLNHQKKWNCFHTKPKWNKSAGEGDKDTRIGFCGPFLRILEDKSADLQRTYGMPILSELYVNEQNECTRMGHRSPTRNNYNEL
jgi:hypothetical protein